MIGKNEVSFIEYNGSDDVSTKVNGIPFSTFEIESTSVFVTLLADGTVTALVPDVDFSYLDLGVNGVDGSITLINIAQAWVHASGGLNSTYKITIEIDTEAFQPGSFRALGNYSPITLEKVLDRLTMNLKAMNRELAELAGNTQIPINTAAIAALEVRMAAAEADILALTLRVNALEAFLYSSKESITAATSANLLATINEITDEMMIFEYVVRRGSSFQYGRELIIDESPFTMSQLQKIGNSGITFTVVESGGVGTIRYTATAGVAATIQYSLYKFSV